MECARGRGWGSASLAARGDLLKGDEDRANSGVRNDDEHTRFTNKIVYSNTHTFKVLQKLRSIDHGILIY